MTGVFGLPDRYSLDNIRKVLANPGMAAGEVNNVATRANVWFHGKLFNGAGVRVMDEEWDNLIILDGCRFDTFAETNWLDGNLRKVTSLGGQSWEFLEGNFDGRQFHDTVYVSSNPYTSKLAPGTFHDVMNVYETHWDEELRTVPPERVTEQTAAVSENYPDKRLITHYMQPHIPFIGQRGRQIDQNGIAKYRDVVQTDRTVWQMLRYRTGEVDRTHALKCYRENLELVLESVENLLPDLPGKTVVTSDHGNLIGDWLWPVPVRGYGHHPNLRVGGLVDVPWLEIDKGNRKDIVSESPVESEPPASDSVRSKLQKLGYR